MTSSPRLSKTISQTALITGLPCGILFAALGSFLLWYYPFHLEFTHTPYDQYILPAAWGIVITIGFIVFIWKGGQKIKYYIDNEFSLVRSGFLYSSYVSVRILFLAVIFFTGVAAQKNDWQQNMDVLQNIIWITSGIVILFIFATIFIALTIGVMTSHIAKIIITSANADLSLMEYAE